METRAIRNAVLKVRASKGMLEDAARYLNPAMESTKRADQVRIALRAQYGEAVAAAASDAAGGPSSPVDITPDFDRHSCGSFFMNPILTAEQAARLPEDAPRFDAALPDGTPGVKTSAAWLIDHAGFHKGFKTAEDAKAGLSTMHTLALTNRGGASASRRGRTRPRGAGRCGGPPTACGWSPTGGRRHGPAVGWWRADFHRTA